MALVKVKEKYQVTLPASVRRNARVAVGDLLEAEVKGRKITLTPKLLVDRDFIERRLAEGLADIRTGRVLGPFMKVVVPDLFVPPHRGHLSSLLFFMAFSWS